MKILSFLYRCLYPYSRGEKTYLTTRLKFIFEQIETLIYKLFNPYLLHKGIRLHGKPEIYQPEKLNIGVNVSLNGNVFLNCMGGISIGNNVVISHGVTILSTTLDPKDFDKVETRKEHKFKKVTIGDGVWLCANATILPGVSIAPCCIIAAGVVVTKSIEEPGWIYGGVPARPIRKV